MKEIGLKNTLSMLMKDSLGTQGSENDKGSKAHTKQRVEVCKLQSLRNISYIISGETPCAMTKNKVEKHFQGNERGESLKACTQNE